jgi:hypothetical protein
MPALGENFTARKLSSSLSVVDVPLNDSDDDSSDKSSNFSIGQIQKKIDQKERKEEIEDDESVDHKTSVKGIQIPIEENDKDLVKLEPQQTSQTSVGTQYQNRGFLAVFNEEAKHKE